ncbi:hypothetical protein GGI25_002126 [Coemansia spiralis]|uniref:Uncharacterized protein n=2 Tax=Coemansia TaxID=4863 RepID=A0A9W8GBA1_9FUNG|nr:hypothetical protein EDC05_001046 [Coemansia umbellata]KAJ2625610.1 hypothetical protein GGI26_000410 [Coemansia sp. RSA 1358]KAJ2678741.1 hypothetical protein GGI25_002126 [Coemansia spiralis]
MNSADILIEALGKSPLHCAENVLMRISEARSINSSAYIHAIIDAIREDNNSNSEQGYIRLKSHLVNLSICESLLDAISKTDISDNVSVFEPWPIITLCDIANQRKWKLDHIVLKDVSLYLAKLSLYHMAKHLREAISNSSHRLQDSAGNANDPTSENPCDKATLAQISLQLPNDMLFDSLDRSIEIIFAQNNPKLFPNSDKKDNSNLSVIAIEAAMEIARHLIDSGHLAKESQLVEHIVRALCAHEREVDAEWIFFLTRNESSENLGVVYAAMMSMYYRIGKPEKAEALFEEFNDHWHSIWKKTKNVVFMPDQASTQVEIWRMTHEKNIEDAQVISADELRALRNQYSAPFFRRALEFIYKEDIAKATEAIRNARYDSCVVLSPVQLNIIIGNMVERDYLEQAYDILTSFLHGKNDVGLRKVLAHQITFAELPGSMGISSILKKLGALGDWDRVWNVINNTTDVSRKSVSIDTMQWLLMQALSTKDILQAIKLTNAIIAIGFQDGDKLGKISDECIRRLFISIIDHSKIANSDGQHQYSALFERLIHKNATAQGQEFQEWNARIVALSLNVISDSTTPGSLQAWNEISSTIRTYGLVKQRPVCLVVSNLALSLLKLIPKKFCAVPTSIDDMPDGGWDALCSNNPALFIDKAFVCAGTSWFWECSLDAFIRMINQPIAKNTQSYIQLALKFAYTTKSRLSPQIIASANKILLASDLPVVNPITGDLLSPYDQSRMHRGYQAWKENNSNSTDGRTTSNSRQRVSREKPTGFIKSCTPPSIEPTSALSDKIKWYKSCYNNHVLPELSLFGITVSEAMASGDRSFWEPVVRDHMPKYIEALDIPSNDGPTLRQRYTTTIWSHAVFAYAKLGEIEEAADYFRRIVNLGSYPIAEGTAMLLSSILSSTLPLPVLPKGWHGEAVKVFELDPVYPPQGPSSADLFLVPPTLTMRQKAVAGIGLSMLYSMLRHGIWPTTHFYTILLVALGRAKMIAELRHIFTTVMPLTMRAMPAVLRINPQFMPSPMIWSMAIREAVDCGEQALAEYWFKEYRMSAMPLFREDASAYSRFTYRKAPKYDRLFTLSRPYYLVPQLKSPTPAKGASQEEWYSLQEVEKQLEMDRLRALDKLPLAYIDAVKMLTIYTLVEEHRNMDTAEMLADEIIALYKDTRLPKHARPRGHADMAFCWRLMVLGYGRSLRQLYNQCLLDDPNITIIRKSQTRLAHWLKKWKEAFKLTNLNNSNVNVQKIQLNDQEIRTAIELCSRAIT